MALVHQTLDDILAQTLHNASQGRELAANVIQYLEGDTAWVVLYSATGELVIPSTLEVHEGLEELFTSLQQVRYVVPIRLATHLFYFGFIFQRLAHSRPPTGSPSPWREIRIPVDVPRMNVSLGGLSSRTS